MHRIPRRPVRSMLSLPYTLFGKNSLNKNNHLVFAQCEDFLVRKIEKTEVKNSNSIHLSIDLAANLVPYLASADQSALFPKIHNPFAILAKHKK